MSQASKTYVREFGSAMTAYVVMLIGVIWLLPQLGDSPLRYGLAILPAVPVGPGVAAFIRYLGRMDELQQRIQLAGLAFAAGTIGLLTFTYGLLEIAGLPHISWVWIFPAMILLWGLGTAVASRRYQ
jgi:hypothetical protein